MVGKLIESAFQITINCLIKHISHKDMVISKI